MAEQLDELQWKSPEWIQSFGLRTDNVLEYFSESPFFDRTSNNQTVKMQSQFQEGYQGGDIENELKKLTGVEFVLLHVREPDFWIITKQYRHDPVKVDPISDYFIIGANVYMAPNVRDVISSRLLSSALSLKNVINKLADLSQFTPMDGHTYKVVNVNDSSRSRTMGNTPYTPGTPMNPGGPTNGTNKSEITQSTVDNLFNVSLNGTIAYVDDKED